MKLKTLAPEEKPWQNSIQYITGRLPVCLVKAVLSSCMYDVSKLTGTKAEHLTELPWIPALEKTLKSSWSARRFNQSIPKGKPRISSLKRSEAETPQLWPDEEELLDGEIPWCWERLSGRGRQMRRLIHHWPVDMRLKKFRSCDGQELRTAVHGGHRESTHWVELTEPNSYRKDNIHCLLLDALCTFLWFWIKSRLNKDT